MQQEEKEKRKKTEEDGGLMDCVFVFAGNIVINEKKQKSDMEKERKGQQRSRSAV